MSTYRVPRSGEDRAEAWPSRGVSGDSWPLSPAVRCELTQAFLPLQVQPRVTAQSLAGPVPAVALGRPLPSVRGHVQLPGLLGTASGSRVLGAASAADRRGASVC